MISQYVRPKTSPITTAVHWEGDLRLQNPAIRKSKLVSDMICTGAAAGITDPFPALIEAKPFVVLARGLRPAHCLEPTSQSRS